MIIFFKILFYFTDTPSPPQPYVPGSFSSKAAKAKFFSSGPALLASSFDKSVLQVYFLLFV